MAAQSSHTPRVRRRAGSSRRTTPKPSPRPQRPVLDPPGPPASDPAWSPMNFYRTMLNLFRGLEPNPKDPGPPRPADPAHPPFFLSPEPERLMSERRYRAAEGCYATARVQDWWRRFPKTATAARVRRRMSATAWPAPLPGEDPYALTPAARALGRLVHATNKMADALARREVADAATRGPIATRRALRAARAAMPQAQARFSLLPDRRRPGVVGPPAWAALEEVVESRARRQFLWRFVRAELRAAVKKTHGHDWTLKDSPDDFAEERAAFVRVYPFLGLTVTDVLRGLRRARPADHDTADRFGISPSSVRTLLTR